jgi:hypothetical protein
MERDTMILHEIYRRAFAASQPPGDWDKLLENATVNQDGQKEIPFMDYECEAETMESIFQDVMKEFKVPKWRRMAFHTSFMLGCSPKTKHKIDESNS